MIIDINKIKKLLASDMTSYRVAQLTNVKQPVYYRYQTGQTPVENMTLKTAKELMKLINLEENTMDKGVKNFLEEVWENITWEGMETVLYKDGDNWTRQQGSQGIDEEDVIYTLPLDLNYWADSYFMYQDEDGNVVKDETIKKDFKMDMLGQVKRDLDL
ncbi:hypothetical protein KV134_08680 [Tetragenococcus halophilus]|nr:hypothetical protein KV134_08680 [Tetragenococcus halophilus]